MLFTRNGLGAKLLNDELSRIPWLQLRLGQWKVTYNREQSSSEVPMGYQFLRRFLSSLALSLMLGALPVSGQENSLRCDIGGYDPELRPDPEGVATPVRITLFVVYIEQVNDVDQSFRTDLFAVFRWADPRLAESVMASGRENCRFSPEAIWTPHLALFNRRDTAFQAPAASRH